MQRIRDPLKLFQLFSLGLINEERRSNGAAKKKQSKKDKRNFVSINNQLIKICRYLYCLLKKQTVQKEASFLFYFRNMTYPRKLI